MQKYTGTVQDLNGNAISGATIKITTYPADVDAVTYSDNGVIPKTNPLTSDAFGKYTFYAADGRYSTRTSGAGILGTIFEPDSILLEDPASIVITGGSIDNTPIGANTPSTGAFTALSATGNVTLGDASTDTLNVGNGGIIKDASGNVGIGVTPSYKLDVLNTINVNSGGVDQIKLTGLAANRYSGISSSAGTSNNYNGLFLNANGNGVGDNGSQGNTALPSWRLGLGGGSNEWVGGDAFAISRVAPGATYTTPTIVFKVKQGASIALEGATPQTGTGISFPSTQSPSTDPNTLDDYEEGTWTPVVAGSTTAGIGTYTTQSGWYTKIGRAVHLQGYIDMSAHTGTGNIRITGLPFTQQTSNSYAALSFSLQDNIALTAGNVLGGYVDSGTAVIWLAQNPTGGGVTAQVPMDTAFRVSFSCTYFV
jgi:hypothetical protein